MTQCSNKQMIFPFYKSKSLTVNFQGGDISTDGGLLFVRQLDDELGVSKRITEVIDDERDQRYTTHELQTLIRQRLYQIIAGYEDCNDANTLRDDPIFKVSCDRGLEKEDALASQPTFSRWENAIRASELYRLSELLVDLFVLQQKRTPKVLILDLDPTDDPAHGSQQLALFNGFYDQHMLFPLLIYEGGSGHLLAAVLRAGNASSADGAVAILRRLVRKLRSRWPKVRLIIRADGGFAVPELYDFCEQEKLEYVIGFQMTGPLKLWNYKNLQLAHSKYDTQNVKIRLVCGTYYRAKSWIKRRRVVVKTEVGPEGENQRAVITNLPGIAEVVYEFYIGRGGVENPMIKELKLDLKADRLSCHRFAANQFRLLLHAFAYVLWHQLRQRLHRTDWASARIETLRLQLIKVAARVRQTFRRIWVELASGYPWKQLWQELFPRVCCNLPDG